MDQEFDDAQQQRNVAEEQKLEEQKLAENTNLSMTIDSNINFSKISLLYNSQQSRPNADLVCVVDVSGSMASEATIQNSDGDLESKGLSILDIVKHAVKTIADNLQENDRMSLVTFDDKAELIFGLTPMNKAGKTKAMDSIDSLRDLNSTNLWDGVFQGLEVLRTQSQVGKNQAVLVFTDGMPNVVPPRGHIPMLKQYKEKYPDMKPVIHTFGFGYSMDSQLLDDIAQEASGIYAFIPDSSLVGTVFVNSLSNILPTMASNVQVNIELLNGAKIGEQAVPGGYQHMKTSWGVQLELGTIQEGQSKDIILNLEIQDQNQPFAQVTVKYLDLLISKSQEISKEASQINNDQTIEIQRIRLIIVDCIKAIFEAMTKEDPNKAKQIIKETNDLINSFQFAKSNAYVMDLLKDLNGQISEASSRQDWFKKWGRHYLLSLMRAHLSQICNNFKDPGVQHYGGKLFKQIRDQADEAFLKLPPPKPSKQAYIQKKGQGGFGQKQKLQSKAVNMSSYHNARGPCFSGNCLIQLLDGNKKKVSELKRGDKVKTRRNTGDKIACIVETLCKDGVSFVEFEDGLKITAWHPICINNEWTFPIQVNKNIKFEQGPTIIYSIVLENDYSMFINGIECSSLGHNQTTENLAHPYFGSKKVIEDLSQMKGWENGTIRLNSPCVQKNSKTGLIEKLTQTF